MAVPKRRTSKTRRDKRRSHDALVPPPRSLCPECGTPKPPHRACSNCGRYRGRTAIETEEE